MISFRDQILEGTGGKLGRDSIDCPYYLYPHSCCTSNYMICHPFQRGCQEEVREPVARMLKKSAIFETIYNSPDHSHDEEVEVSKDEADKVVCKPTPGPTFNWETWTFEYPILKNVYFYYNELQSQCCNR